MNRDGYRDQIVTCDVGASLHSKTHPLFMKYSNGTSTQCYAYHYPSLFPVLFLQSLYEGLRGKVGQPKIKCGKLSKHYRNALKSGYSIVRSTSLFTEFSPCPETHFTVVSS